MKISRRSFLKTTGAASLAAVLPTMACSPNDNEVTLNFGGSIQGEKHHIGHKMRDGMLQLSAAKCEEKTYDVVILGGGLSGLTTAHRLCKAGKKNVLILEKEAVAGGLCRGGEENGLAYSCGAHYTDFPSPENKYLNEIYEDCGVIIGYDKFGWPVVDNRFLLKDEGYNLYVDGNWEEDDYPFRKATDADLAEYDRFVELTKYISAWRDNRGKAAVGLPVANLSQDAWVQQLDQVSMADYLREKGFRSDLLFWYCNIWIIDEYGVKAEEVSAWAGFQFFRHKDLPDGKEVHTVTFPQGLSYIAQQLQGQLPAHMLRLNQWAVHVKQAGERVYTTVWDEAKQQVYTVQSKQLVFALPKPQVYHIIPSLRLAGRSEFEGHRYAPWLVATIHLSALPDYKGGGIKWDNTIFDSWTMGYVNNQHQQRNSQQQQGHIVSLYACYTEALDENRKQMLHQPWEFWAKMVVRELKKAHPEIEQLITKLDCWLWGHPMRQPVVGSAFGEKRKAMQRPFGRIHFGHVDVCAVPIAEEAIWRAGEISDLLLAEL